jgi:hypothetical protein
MFTQPWARAGHTQSLPSISRGKNSSAVGPQRDQRDSRKEDVEHGLLHRKLSVSAVSAAKSTPEHTHKRKLARRSQHRPSKDPESGDHNNESWGDTRQPTSQQTCDRPPRHGSGRSKERVRLCLLRLRNDRSTSEGLAIREPARK